MIRTSRSTSKAEGSVQRTYRRLTTKRVEQIIKNGAPGRYPDGDGLYLQKTPASICSWLYRYQRGAKEQHLIGLGPLRHVSLAEARKKADELRALRRDGKDPLETRRAEKRARAKSTTPAMTFRECALAYIAAHKAGWRNARASRQWGDSLERLVYPAIGDIPIGQVDTAAVLSVLEPHWYQMPETMNRVRRRIEAVLDYAKSRELRSGENPARWKNHVRNLLPPRSKLQAAQHHKAIDYREIAGFMADLKQMPGVAPLALQFVILSACRVGEVVGAKWDEINLKERLWSIPATRMKAGRPHTVPLSDEAVAVLARMAELRSGPFVFPGGLSDDRPLSSASLPKLLKRMKRDDMTSHGMRAAFRTFAGEATSTAREIAELSLAHRIGNSAENAYVRGDLLRKRAVLMSLWGRHCMTPASGEIVVALHRQPA
jgi:integrase